MTPSVEYKKRRAYTTKDVDSFSLDSSGVAEPARPVIPKVELDAVVKRVTTKWIRPQGATGRIIVVDTAIDLPSAILGTANAQKVPRKEITGAFHPGHNHLVCEKHNDARQIEETIPRENYATWTPRPRPLNLISFSNSTLIYYSHILIAVD